MAETATISSADPEAITMKRLEDQINWYSAKSKYNQNRFKLIKTITILSAAMIPILSTAGIPNGSRIAAGLGVLIAIIEGLLQMNQYNANWTSYRATSEALKHEKYLYLAKAGPYRNLETPQAVLAERVEALVSQEQAKWLNVQSDKPKDSSQN